MYKKTNVIFLILLAILPMICMLFEKDSAFTDKLLNKTGNINKVNSTLTPGTASSLLTDTETSLFKTYPIETSAYTPIIGSTDFEPDNTGNNHTDNPANPSITPSSKPSVIIDTPTNKNTPPFLLDMKYTNSDIPLAQVNVKQFGAVGDGRIDDTQAFIDAINHCKQNTNAGIIYIPEGVYLLTRPITVDNGIVMRGDWSFEKTYRQKDGTILLIKTGENNEAGKAAITINNATLMNITLCYPDQNVTSPIPYSPAVSLDGEVNNLSNITLVNPYIGITNCNFKNSINNLREIYITPLKYGLYIDGCEVYRNENIYIGAKYWSAFKPYIDSGLYKGLTSDDVAELQKYMLENTIGMYLKDCDMLQNYGVLIEDVNTAFKCSDNGSSYAELYYCVTRNCKYGIQSIYSCENGITVTNCDISAISACVKVEPTSAGIIKLNSSKFRYAVYGILSQGSADSYASAINCAFVDIKNAVKAETGNTAIIQCTVYGDSNIKFENTIKSGAFIGNTGGNYVGNNKVVYINSALNLEKISNNIRLLKTTPNKPYSETVYNVLDYGAKAADPDVSVWTDCTGAFQRAINAAKETGGIVFVPGGVYNFKGTLTIPEGVELRGIYSSFTYPDTQKECWLFVRGGTGSVHASKPFIQLGKNAGIRGLNIYYPDQKKVYKGETPISYAWTIQGRGTGVYCIGVGAYNGSKFCDFGSEYNCTGYYFASSGGAMYDIGFYGGNNQDSGWVEDAYFNIEWLLKIKQNFPNSGYTSDSKIINDRIRNLYEIALSQNNGKGFKAFVYGYNAVLNMINTFSCGAIEGVRFESQNNHSTNGTVIGHYSKDCGYGISVIQVNSVEIINTTTDTKDFSEYDVADFQAVTGLTGKVVLAGSSSWGDDGKYANLSIAGGKIIIQQYSHMDKSVYFIKTSNATAMIQGCIEAENSVTPVSITGGNVSVYGNSRKGEAFDTGGAVGKGNWGY